MAERRMFAKQIIDSDAFLDMPLSAQALYFHLSMRADDDGFINNPKKTQRLINASDDDFKLLLLKRFVLAFESGVVVIKHWRIHNYIRNDRYKPTVYTEERNTLMLNKNGAYTDKVYQMDTDGIPNGYQMETQYRLGEVSLGKDSKESACVCEDTPTLRFTPPTIEEVAAYCKERNNNVDAEQFIAFYTSKGWMVGKNKMKDWKACVRTWERRDAKPRGNVENFIHRDYTDEEMAEMFKDINNFDDMDI